MVKGRSRRQLQNSKSFVPDHDCGPTHLLGPPGKLPIEVWMEIIKQYSRRKEWLALCETSRFFHQIAQICLYKRLDFDTFEERKRIWRCDPRTSLALFEEALQAGPELGSFIRDLSLRVYPPNRTRFSPRTLMSKIDRLRNLERLVIRDSAVNTELRDAIYSRPNLRALEFWECMLDGSLLTPRTQHGPQSSIVDLRIFGAKHNPSVPDALWATFVPAGLRSLELSVDFKLDGNAIFSNIMVSGNMLEKLTIYSIPRCIIQFLVSSPQLRHLVIAINPLYFHHELLVFSSLPGDALPLLDNYHGPAKLLPIFLRNRPVHSVQLTHMPITDKFECAIVLDSLQLSLVPVTALMFSCNLEGRWMSHIPITTHHLLFDMHLKENFKKITLPALSHLTNLRSICFKPRVQNTRFSRNEILKVSETLPSLRELGIEGYGKWLMVEQKVWEQFKYIKDL